MITTEAFGRWNAFHLLKSDKSLHLHSSRLRFALSPAAWRSWIRSLCGKEGPICLEFVWVPSWFSSFAPQAKKHIFEGIICQCKDESLDQSAGAVQYGSNTGSKFTVNAWHTKGILPKPTSAGYVINHRWIFSHDIFKKTWRWAWVTETAHLLPSTGHNPATTFE